MAEAEETPAQRQARIRRQKREAKINSTAAERLNKITQASGRTPEMMKNDSPAATPPVIATPPQAASPMPGQGMPPFSGTADPAQVQAQEEYLRSLLRAPPPPQNQGPGQAQQQEDPMMKMLSSMLGGVDESGNSNAGGGLPFSPDDISKATGLPSFVTNMLLGGQKAPPTPAEERSMHLWKIVHVVFSILAGIYLVLTVSYGTKTFGKSPPAPATIQNPFLAFATGELVIQGTRIATAGQSGKNGPGLWLQMLKELAGDGAIVVFLLGCASWWSGNT